MLIEISSSILSIIGVVIIYYGLSGIPFHSLNKIYKIIFIMNIPFFIALLLINILFIFFRYFDKINNEFNLLSYYISMLEMIISTINLFINLIYDSFVLKEIVNISFTNKEWLFTKAVLSIIPIILINLLLMNVADNLLISLKINGSYRQYELAIEAENNINRKREENNSNTEGSTEGSSNNSNNNGITIINTSANQVNGIENNNANVNVNENLNNNLNSIKGNDKNNVNIIINNNLNNSNINGNNNKINSKEIYDIKSSVMSTNRLIKNDNDMNENLAESEEIKY